MAAYTVADAAVLQATELQLVHKKLRTLPAGVWVQQMYCCTGRAYANAMCSRHANLYSSTQSKNAPPPPVALGMCRINQPAAPAEPGCFRQPAPCGAAGQAASIWLNTTQPGWMFSCSCSSVPEQAQWTGTAAAGGKQHIQSRCCVCMPRPAACRAELQSHQQSQCYARSCKRRLQRQPQKYIGSRPYSSGTAEPRQLASFPEHHSCRKAHNRQQQCAAQTRSKVLQKQRYCRYYHHRHRQHQRHQQRQQHSCKRSCKQRWRQPPDVAGPVT